MSAETREALREEGKRLYFREDADREERNRALALLERARVLGDAEAGYLQGMLMLEGRIVPKSGDRTERALRLLASASQRGSSEARALLDRLCRERYDERIRFEPAPPAPLKDFDGKPFRIRRRSALTPVEAELSFREGENVLRLHADIRFAYLKKPAFDKDAFESAVLRGFLDWQGTYEVFGGQRLRVELDLSAKGRPLGCVRVLPLPEGLRARTEKLAKAFLPRRPRERVTAILSGRRSFAWTGVVRWSVRSPKTVWMQSEDGAFSDAENTRCVARHEFGHVLGLGDLYASESDGLGGVDPDRYEELACFRLFDRRYHMVMCDHSAPVCGNDIEMLVLAFSENRYQRFQPERFGKRISKALGRGN